MKYLFALTLSLIPAVASAATSVTRFGITWTWVEDLTVGYYVNGDPYVVAPDGITWVGQDPVSTLDGTRVRNGAMINPVASQTTPNGFDSGVTHGAYSEALNAARLGGAPISAENPRAVATNSSIVSGRSVTGIARPQLTDAAVLTIVSEAPPEGSFRPPYCGGDKTPRWNVSGVNWSLLRNLPAVSGTPSLTSSYSWFDRPWIEINTDGNAGRYLHPANNQPDYGRDMAKRVGNALMLLHLEANVADKRPLLIGLVQYGLDIFGAIKSGGIWRDLGGLNQGRKAPLLFAGLMLGDTEILSFANPALHFKFLEDRSTFYVAQPDVDRGHPAHEHCNPSFGNVVDRAHMPAVCNRYCSGGSPGDNRRRDVYTTDLIGLPEWGEQHTSQPIRDGSNWDVLYRDLVYNSLWLNVLAIDLIPGGRAAWGWPALFDYMDRARTVQPPPGVGAGDNPPTNFEWNSWTAYRHLGGPVWSETTVAPTVTSQPPNRTITVGASTTFPLSATGTPVPTYQWRRDGVNLANGGRISGVTTATLSLSNAQLADIGYYDCIVSSTAGFVLSDAAFLEVNDNEPEPPPAANTVGRSRGKRLLGGLLN